MIMDAIASVLFLAVPLLPVLIVLIIPYARRALALAPWVPASAVLLLPLHGTTVDYPWLLLGARVGLDDTGLVLLILATIVWTAAGVHARHSIAHADQPRFYIFWLATWCGNLCVFLTQDAASFYAAYAMMTFAAWGLVVHYRRPEDYAAGRFYLVMALIGEALILAGLFLLAAQVGNAALGPFSDDLAGLDHAGLIATLFAAGFGVKMAIFGLHMWLPTTYTQAPTAAAAVLAGVMLKAGLAGWLRFLPFGEPGFTALGAVAVALGLFMGFYAAGMGLCQTRPRTILAWSSPSQMLFVTVPVGLALMEPAAAPLLLTLAVAFALHHGLVKGALFLGVDFARDRPRLARLLVWLPAASLAGLPLTSGALAKVSFKSQLPAMAGWLEPILLLASVATTLLVIRFLLRVHGRGADRIGAPTAPWYGLLVASLIAPWFVYGHTATGIGWDALARPFAPGYLLETAGPVVVGIVLATWVIRRWPGLEPPTIPSPPQLVHALAPSRRPAAWRPDRTRLPQLPVLAVAPRLDRGEARLALMSIAVVLWLALVAALFLM